MRIRRSVVSLSLAAMLVVALGLARSGASSTGGQLLEFGRMAPVVAPFTGTVNPIRGINGGGVPWQVAAAKGELSAAGKLEVEVEGLVLASSGTNPIGSFRAVVNCLTVDSPTTGVNLVTDPVPTTSAGDAKFEAQLDLPHPCVAPIVFVTNGGGTPPGAWFATTGAS